MLRYLTIIILLINFNNNILAGPGKAKNYLIIGTNGAEKLYFATSSNLDKNHEGEKAIDSDDKSSWISGNTGPHWIEIDFGAKRLMNKLIIRPGKKDNYPTLKKIVIQFMYENVWFDFISYDFENKKSWSPFGSGDDAAEIDLGGVDASRFRILIPADATYDGCAAVAEIETYIGSIRLKFYDERLKGMFLPIENGLLPSEDSMYPGAPRPYRGGTHAGVDIYFRYTENTYEPVPVDGNTPVCAAKDGVIIRADRDYTPVTAAEWKNQSLYYSTHPETFVKGSFGGRQIWIDHEDGIVTTYNHLSKIEDGIRPGVKVKKGEKIGLAGNSGLLGEAEGKSYGTHLHFEIWVDGRFLGKDMNIRDVKRYITWIFSIH